jgi:hypothetical protein
MGREIALENHTILGEFIKVTAFNISTLPMRHFFFNLNWSV